MPDVLLNWATVSAAVVLLIGGGVGLLRTTPAQFTAARWCFSAAYLLLAFRVGWWTVIEQTEGMSPFGVIGVALLLGGLGLLWLGVMKWVDDRQAAAALAAQRRAVRRVQRDTLAGFLARAQELRHTFVTLDPVPSAPAEEWEQEVLGYLEDNLGPVYVIRFRTPATRRPISMPQTEVADENKKMCIYLDVRIARLMEFVKELGD